MPPSLEPEAGVDRMAWEIDARILIILLDGMKQGPEFQEPVAILVRLPGGPPWVAGPWSVEDFECPAGPSGPTPTIGRLVV